MPTKPETKEERIQRAVEFLRGLDVEQREVIYQEACKELGIKPERR
jgi:hypothetical protein